MPYKSGHASLKCLIALIFICAFLIFTAFRLDSLAQNISLPEDLGGAQGEETQAEPAPSAEAIANQPQPQAMPALEELKPLPEEETATTPVLETKEPVSGNVTLDFKDADIRNVLRILSYKSGINIVTSPDVSGMITIRLMDVPWQTALDVILKTYGFGYEKHENIIAVSPLDKLTAQKKAELELTEVQPTETRVFNLKFTDAGDMKKAIENQLSPRGKITVLEMTGPAGWEFGTTEFGKRKRLTEERRSRSKTLIISDVPPVLEKIGKIILELDKIPQQVLIEARIMEVTRDVLKDIGIDFGTGSGGAATSTVTGTPIDKDQFGNAITTGGGHVLTSQTPSGFVSKAGTLTADNTGLKLVYQKFSGNQFEVILHALEEDVRTNTLSAPRILTINNQEASILVGTKYPILSTTQSEGVYTTSLSYYQDIGIQLNVVPQINADNFINMIIHPAVTSISSLVGDNSYPVVASRETEAQILIKNGETIVIGGLLKDIKTKSKFSVPLLGDIPFLGKLFQRNTEDVEKVDLLVFITAHIVESEAALAKLEEKITPKPAEEAVKSIEQPVKSAEPVKPTEPEPVKKE